MLSGPTRWWNVVEPSSSLRSPRRFLSPLSCRLEPIYYCLVPVYRLLSSAQVCFLFGGPGGTFLTEILFFRRPRAFFPRHTRPHLIHISQTCARAASSSRLNLQSQIMVLIDIPVVHAEIDLFNGQSDTGTETGTNTGTNTGTDHARDDQQQGTPSQSPPSTSAAPRARTLSVFLVRNVSNAAAVRADILAGATANETDASGACGSVDAAFMDATLIPSLSVLRSAAAMACQNLPALKTKTIHAELVWSLSGNRHTGRALSTFGIQDTGRHVLAAKFDATERELEWLRGRVEGEVVEEREAVEAALREVCDSAKVKKVYGICQAELEIGNMEESVVGRIAARDTAT